MPCSLAIRRGLRRTELPADAKERGGRTPKKGEGEGGHGEEGRPVYPGERIEGWRWGGEKERQRWGIYALHTRDAEWGSIFIAAMPMKEKESGGKEDKGRGGNGQGGGEEEME